SESGVIRRDGPVHSRNLSDIPSDPGVMAGAGTGRSSAPVRCVTDRQPEGTAGRPRERILESRSRASRAAERAEQSRKLRKPRKYGRPSKPGSRASRASPMALRRGTPVTYTQIEYVVRDGIATITLNRPHRMNAYTYTMRAEMLDAFDRIDADDEVRVVV